MILRFLNKILETIIDTFNWLILEMDVTQWAVVAIVFVVMGFQALRTRF